MHTQINSKLHGEITSFSCSFGYRMVLDKLLSNVSHISIIPKGSCMYVCMCVNVSAKHLLICPWPFAGLWSPDCVSLFLLHLIEYTPRNHACKYTALKRRAAIFIMANKVHLKSLWLPMSWAISAHTIPIRRKNSQFQSFKLDYINNINKTANWMCGLRDGERKCLEIL